MNLQDIQSDFQRIVLGKECVGADWVDETASNLSSSERLFIYHNAYRVRLTEVMEDTFEHTAVYLGNEWFYRLASAYVERHPSVYTNIGLYGESFSDFLHKQLPDDGDVAELANMDWILRRAFDDADSQVMTLADLAQIVSSDPSQCKLKFVPTLRRVWHHYNTLEIWHAIDKDQTPPEAEKRAEPIEILVWRKAYSPHFRSISPLESYAIDCIEKGLTLDEVGEILQTQFPEQDVSTAFGVLIQRWINDEMLCLP